MTDGAAATQDTPFANLVAVMARLRSDHGCPWDQEQTHRSLRPCLLEETYEVLDAIDRGDRDSLRQELGDLLLQVVFHAQLAAEAGEFTVDDVVRGLYDKLIGRHPHVFGQACAATPSEVLHQWDRIKRAERGENEADVVTGVPATMPALLRAQVVQRRAARAGIAREPDVAAAAARNALQQLMREEGDQEQAVSELLLAAVDLARARGVDAEQALRERVARFTQEVQGGALD